MFASVFTKTLYDLRRGLLGWSIGIAAMVALMAAIWPSFADVDFDALTEQYPDAMKEVFNISDMSTAAGYLNAELFSLLLPALFIVYAIGRGAQLVAGEESDGTMETLTALPIRRSRILVEKAAALATALAALALVLFASMWASSLATGMDLRAPDIANATIVTFFLGFEFGLVALALSAGTGRRGAAIGLASALAAGAYLLFLMGQLVDTFAPYLELSPFYQATSEGPLGPTIPALALAMPITGLAALAISLPVFSRRDLVV